MNKRKEETFGRIKCLDSCKWSLGWQQFHRIEFPSWELGLSLNLPEEVSRNGCFSPARQESSRIISSVPGENGENCKTRWEIPSTRLSSRVFALGMQMAWPMYALRHAGTNSSWTTLRAPFPAFYSSSAIHSRVPREFPSERNSFSRFLLRLGADAGLRRFVVN